MSREDEETKKIAPERQHEPDRVDSATSFERWRNEIASLRERLDSTEAALVAAQRGEEV